MQTANQAAAPIAYVVRPGELTNFDAGQYSGSFIITDMSLTGAADDNWTISLTGQLTGVPTYTAAA
jgi:predicted secreted protein